MLMLLMTIASLSMPLKNDGHLVIYPKIPGLTYEQLRTRDDGTVVAAYIPPRPDSVVDLDAAFAVFEGAPYVDVVEGVTWEIVSTDQEHEFATINELGEITFTDSGRVRVRATFMGIVSDEMRVTWSQTSKVGPWDEEGPGGPSSPGPTNEQTGAAVRNGVGSLEQRYGHIISPLFSSVALSTSIQTNSGTAWYSALPGSYLGSSGVAAAYGNGARETPGGGVYVSGPLIVVADSVAAAIVADGLTDANGHLTENGQTIIHELLHAVLDQFGIKMSEALEEALAHAFGELLANKLMDLTDRLENAARNGATKLDQSRIAALIQSIIAELRKIRAQAKNAKDKRALDLAFTLLNLDDRDGDGVPDIIEDMIDRLFPERPEWLEEILRKSVVEDAGDPIEIVPD